MKRIFLLFVFLFIFSPNIIFGNLITTENITIKVSPKIGAVTLIFKLKLPKEYCNKTLIKQGFKTVVKRAINREFFVNIISTNIKNDSCESKIIVTLYANKSINENLTILYLPWKDNSLCFSNTNMHFIITKNYKILEVTFNNWTKIKKNLSVQYILNTTTIKFNNTSSYIVTLPNSNNSCFQIKEIKLKEIKLKIITKPKIINTTTQTNNKKENSFEKVNIKKILAIVILIIVILGLILYYIKVVRR